jgi:RNA polymerase sigma factor (sigma-70 family)
MAARAPNDQERHARTAPLVEWLAREEWNALARAARRSGAPLDAVADVVQSALLSVLRSFRGPYERRQIRGYTYRCVQREAWDVARRARPRYGGTTAVPVDDVLDEAAAPPDAEPLAATLRADVVREAHAALGELPPDERAALVLLAAGFERAEVRRALGLSERAIRKRVERGNRRLRGR